MHVIDFSCSDVARRVPLKVLHCPAVSRVRLVDRKLHRLKSGSSSEFFQVCMKIQYPEDEGGQWKDGLVA